MKQSNYNISFNIDKKNFIYNSISNSFVEISPQVKELIKMDDLEKIEKKGLDQLIQGNFIYLKDNIDEYNLIINRHYKQINNDTYHLTLLPTLDCNVKCWYCFEKHIKNSRFSTTVKKNILKYLQTILQDKPNISKYIIESFGGEPLLDFEKNLYPLLCDIQNILEKNNKKVFFLFVTNGLEINMRLISLLKRFNPNFQISIDGYKKQHDRIKKLNRDKTVSTYDLVINNIKLLITHLDSNINIRINYDDTTLKSITTIVDSLKNIPMNKVSIHLERVWQTLNTKNDLELKTAIDYFLKNGLYVTYLNFFNRGYSCKSSKINQLAIAYNGDIFKCTGRDFNADLKEGELIDNGKIIWNEKRLNNRLSIKTFSLSECKKCKMLPMCYGPCTQKHIETKDTIKNIMDFCQLRTMEIPIKEYLSFRMRSLQNKIRYE